MSRKILLSILMMLVLITCLPGCGYKEGVLIKEPVSYLWFTGNIELAMVKIDDQEPFDLTKALAAQGSGEGTKVYYQIPPGKHRIIVLKNGQRVVEKDYYIGNGTTQEIQIP